MIFTGSSNSSPDGIFSSNGKCRASGEGSAVCVLYESNEGRGTFDVFSPIFVDHMISGTPPLNFDYLSCDTARVTSSADPGSDLYSS